MHDLLDFHKAMGDETRLRLVALLADQAQGDAMCVSRLARELETSVSNVSQHLRVLRELDLVHSERRRYRVHYFLDRDRFRHYVARMVELLEAEVPVTEGPVRRDSL
jgi:ArsR family transcriptional regulator, lead/cadmium/zinc/bismuth-responsive transcriptional repressor